MHSSMLCRDSPFVLSVFSLPAISLSLSPQLMHSLSLPECSSTVQCVCPRGLISVSVTVALVSASLRSPSRRRRLRRRLPRFKHAQHTQRPRSFRDPGCACRSRRRRHRTQRTSAARGADTCRLGRSGFLSSCSSRAAPKIARASSECVRIVVGRPE